MCGALSKSLGICRRSTNKGKSGFGKVSDRAKTKRLRPQGILGGSVVGYPLNGRPLSGSQSLSQAL